MASSASSSRPQQRWSALEAQNLIQTWLDNGAEDEEGSDFELSDPRAAADSGDEDFVPSGSAAKRARKVAGDTTSQLVASTSCNITVSNAVDTLMPGACTSSTDDDNGEWRSVEEGMTRSRFVFKPLRQPGITEGLDLSTALSSFTTIFTSSIKSYLLKQINDFARMKCMINTPSSQFSVYGRWKDVTEMELDKFLAVLINMGMQRKPYIRDYWSQVPHLWQAWFGQMISRQRFEDIYHTMLHAGEEEAEGKDKIEPFVNLILDESRKAFYPYENLSLDEMVIGFKGRWQYKQFNAHKPKKYHIKAFGLCDAATGYVLNLLFYFGSESSYNPEADPSSGQAKKVFQTLLQPFGTGHHVFADRYYTTRELVDYLLEQETYYTGTLNRNRKDFPPQLKQLKLNHTEMKWYLNSTDRILCVAFRDKKAKKEVLAVSTKAEVKTITTRKKVVKPAIIDSYNQSMNGCDVMDQRIGYYGIHTRKSVKWWKKILMWIFEVAQINSFILYTLGCGKPVRLRDFKSQLLYQLTEASMKQLMIEKSIPSPVPTKSVAAPVKFSDTRHLILYHKNDLRCAHCSTPAKPKRTHFYCSGCPNLPHLHPQCFGQYHFSA